MPQLDSAIFFSQIFFLFIFLFFFYIIIITNILPVISFILKIRKKKLKLIEISKNQEFFFKRNYNKIIIIFLKKLYFPFNNNFQLNLKKIIKNQIYLLNLNTIQFQKYLNIIKIN